MKKLILFIGLLTFGSMFAQDTPEITSDNSWLKIGLTAGVPVGPIHNTTAVAIGVDFRGQYLVNPNFGIGVVSGYTHYFKNNEGKDFGLIPLAGFARYYFTPNGLFIGTDLGYGFLTNVDNNSGGLYVNPQIGYHNHDFNVFAFYRNTFAENNVDIQTVGVGVTYNIRFK